MKIAIFSDIHGNKQALDKILQDIEKQRVEQIFCLGDLVGYGPRPNEVIETIREVDIPTVMGNYDEGIGYDKGECGCAYVTDDEKFNGRKSIEWTSSQVTQKNKEFLKNLEYQISFKTNRYNFLLVHGSPRKINEYLYEDRPEKSLTRMLETIDTDILVCGHTHKPYHRVVNGVHIINDGSVGKPKDGDPRACYVLITIDNNVSVEFKRVNYPIKVVAKEIVEFGLPKVFAKELLNEGK